VPLELLPGLKIVANFGVGYDRIDVAACAAKGVTVTNTPGVLDAATADLAFGLIMAVRREIVVADRFVRSAGWSGSWSEGGLAEELSGSTLGIVGLGRIGSAVARRARGFGMRVLYWGPRRKPESFERQLEMTYAPLDQLLRVSDFVSVHSPLNPETHHQIGKRELALMKPTAFLVNTARGPVVDEAALTRALKKGQIAGAGLDVFEHEPKVTDGLLAMSNVVATPHLGSAVAEVREQMANIVVDNILALLAGKPPPNCINPEVLAACRAH
jgi:glyoxylate reductase